jgi:hypothetical protein
MHAQARKEPERFDALERVGFKTERYGSMTDTLYNRMGGHYMDVGASAKIAKGLVKVPLSFHPIYLLIMLLDQNQVGLAPNTLPTRRS